LAAYPEGFLSSLLFPDSLCPSSLSSSKERKAVPPTKAAPDIAFLTNVRTMKMSEVSALNYGFE